MPLIPYFDSPIPAAAPEFEQLEISRKRISRVPGFDATEIVFSVSTDYSSYEIRVMPSADAPRSEGALLESGGGGLAHEERTLTITDDEFVAATGSAIDGEKTLAIFFTREIYANTMIYADSIIEPEGIVISPEGPKLQEDTLLDEDTLLNEYGVVV